MLQAVEITSSNTAVSVWLSIVSAREISGDRHFDLRVNTNSGLRLVLQGGGDGDHIASHHICRV
jgi:hypothetical protein